MAQSPLMNLGEGGEPRASVAAEVPSSLENEGGDRRSAGPVMIQVDRRAFFGIIALLGTVGLFCVGLFVGLALSGGAPWQRLAAVAGQPARLAANPATQAGTAGLPTGQQPPWVQQNPQPQNPAAPRVKAVAPVKPHAPDGDHPHIEFPDLLNTGNVFDLGDISADSLGTEQSLLVRNSGNQPLIIEDVGAT